MALLQPSRQRDEFFKKHQKADFFSLISKKVCAMTMEKP